MFIKIMICYVLRPPPVSPGDQGAEDPLQVQAGGALGHRLAGPGTAYTVTRIYYTILYYTILCYAMLYYNILYYSRLYDSARYACRVCHRLLRPGATPFCRRHLLPS